MSLTISKVPDRDTRRGTSLFDILVTDRDRHTMKLNPGVTYQLRDDARTHPDLFTTSEVNSLQARARESDIRVQSRAAGDSKNTRHVWISFEPGYVPERRERKKSAS